MTKLFITTIPMQQKNFLPVYKLTDNKNMSYDKPIYYPITVALAENVVAGDDVKLYVIKVEDHSSPEFEENYKKYFGYLQDEIDAISSQVNVNVTIDVLVTNFIETKDVFGQQFMQLFDVIEDNMKIYTDITFGPKPFTMITMNILYFAEKFYDADIEAVIYGKTSFVNNKPDPNTSKVCDISALYYLNNITANMEADSGEEAKKLLSRFFGL